ncbi:MAG: hypothetical protein R3304_10875 [Longimicrobiales bacterium]|nr:hypothetical protein [Longimicrobiales bacterium]
MESGPEESIPPGEDDQGGADPSGGVHPSEPGPGRAVVSRASRRSGLSLLRRLRLLALWAAGGCAWSPAARPTTPGDRPAGGAGGVEERVEPAERTDADGDGPFFYLGRAYGTDAVAGPLDVLLNKGFAVAQFNNRNRYIFDYDYGVRHVWNSITGFGDNVHRYGGWTAYLGDEIVPTSLDWSAWKWAPNYFGHVLEGGMTYRRLSEWNRVHEVPFPALSAAVVTMGAAVINEMYAHPGWVQGTAATATDLLFFDPLGVALFSIDGVAGFFAGPLQGTIWSSQAALTLDGELVNNGNNFIVKLPVSPFPRTSIFIRGGLALTPGLTYHRRDGLDVSVGLGGEGRIQNVDPVTGEETPEIAVGGGIFVDRDGTLLASVMASETAHRRFVVNVYPGVVDVAGGRLGGWLIVRKDWAVRFGVSVSGALGVGAGAGFGR